MSRADSSLQAGPSAIDVLSSKKRPAPEDNTNSSVPLKKVKTEDLENSKSSSSESLKKKRRRKRRKLSVTEISKPPSSIAMRPVVKPASAKPVVSGKSVKGKERAIKPESDEVEKPTLLSEDNELQLLKEELEKQRKLLDAHKSFASSITASLTCQICLEPMLRPYTLAPCGHTSCYSCLVTWFRSPPAHLAGPAPDHLAHNFDRDDPTMLALGAPMLIGKDKTCPHCRAIVCQPPVEAWAVKDIVSHAFATEGMAMFPGYDVPSVVPDAGAGDPWQGIFKQDKERWGWVAELGDGDMEERDRRGFYDEEDDAYRCTRCLHEIWDGVCSSCGRHYDGHSDDEDSFAGDPDFDDMGEVDWMDDGVAEGAMEAYWNNRAFHEMLEHRRVHREEDDEDDDGYESSFIDDDGHLTAALVDAFALDDERYNGDDDVEDDEFDEIHEPPRPRRAAPPRVVRPYERHSLSADEDSDVEFGEEARAARVYNPRQRRIISDDEDEDEADDDEDSEGEVGEVGRTSLLHHLARGWARRTVVSDEGEDDSDEDVD